jgi:hypothetical protein
VFTVVPKNVIYIPSSALDKQHCKNDFGIILTGTSFQAFDVHSTVIDYDALLILPLDVFIQPGIIVFMDKMLEWFIN